MYSVSSSCLNQGCMLGMQSARNMARFGARLYSQQIEYPIVVNNMHEVMTVWSAFKENNPIRTPDPVFGRHVPFPINYGFRGLKNDKYPQTPSAFRTYNYVQSSRSRTFEQAVYYSFRLFVNDPPKDHRSTLDWLSLMQHYDTPTRLLDWSESILTSLFFAVEDAREKKEKKIGAVECNCDEKEKKPEDGVVWVLNGNKLNRITSLFGTETGVGVPESLNTVIRAEMTTAQDLDTIFRRKKILELNAYDLPHSDSLQNIFERVLSGLPPLKDNPELTHEKFLARLHYPFATHTYRLHERIKLQSGFFTVSGGKAGKFDDQQTILPNLPLGEFKSLEDLNREQDSKNKFMLKLCIIPANSKKKIYDELFELGINKATVYADIPNVSKYVVERANRFE